MKLYMYSNGTYASSPTKNMQTNSQMHLKPNFLNPMARVVACEDQMKCQNMLETQCHVPLSKWYIYLNKAHEFAQAQSFKCDNNFASNSAELCPNLMRSKILYETQWWILSNPLPRTYDNNVPKSILDKSHPKGVRKLS